MKVDNPQILYIILILPLAFGATLLGEGIHKLLNGEKAGRISAFFGSLIIFSAFFIYILVSNMI